MNRNDPYATPHEPAKPETRSEVVVVGAAALLVVVICVGLVVDGAIEFVSGWSLP